MSETARTVGASPSWTWAKLRIRLARYTSAIPTATSAPSSPMMTPWSVTPKGSGKKAIWSARTARAGTTRGSDTTQASRGVRSSHRVSPPRPMGLPSLL
jgi:hypothetical protein